MKRVLIAGLALAALAVPAFAADEGYHPTWNLVVQDDVATLNYALADSDDSGPTLFCERARGHNTRPGQLTAYYFTENALHGTTATLRLRSGAVVANLVGRVESDEESGASEVSSHLPLTAPVLTEFARTGRIVFSVGNDTNSPPVVATAKVARLIAVCRG